MLLKLIWYVVICEIWSGIVCEWELVGCEWVWYLLWFLVNIECYLYVGDKINDLIFSENYSYVVKDC